MGFHPLSFGVNAKADAGEHQKHSYERFFGKHVSERVVCGGVGLLANSRFDTVLPSATHSPKTVNTKASEFVMGTVRLSSARKISA